MQDDACDEAAIEKFGSPNEKKRLIHDESVKQEELEFSQSLDKFNSMSEKLKRISTVKKVVDFESEE